MSTASFPTGDGPPAGGGSGTVTSVSGTAPITVGGTATDPIIGIDPASGAAAGSMSAADKTKLDDIALPLDVDDGGTGRDTLTAHAVLVGAGTSDVALVGPSASTGKVFTSHGTSSDPSFDDPITATNDTANLSSFDHALTVDGPYEDIGLSKAVASSGKYLVLIDVISYVLTGGVPSIGDGQIALRLYDVAAAGPVSDSDRLIYNHDELSVGGKKPASLSVLVTLAAAGTIKAQAKCDAGSSTITGAGIYNLGAGGGFTQMNIIKVGD